MELSIALFVALLGLWVVVARDAWRAWQPSRLLLLGRYAEATTAARKLERSWMRIFPSVRISTHYAIACALHLRGELEASLEEIGRLRAGGARGAPVLRGNMDYAISAIEAASLVLLARDPKRAIDLLARAGEIQKPPEDLLLMAHATRQLGDEREADRLFAEAGARRAASGLRLGRVLLLESEEQQEAIFHALRGLYLAAREMPRSEREAVSELSAAAKGSIANVYVERARAMLDAMKTSSSEGEGPSSLAPQVVASQLGTDDDDRT